MTVDLAKEQLHFMIENFDEKKVMAMYTLFAGDEVSSGYVYDEETLKEIEQHADDALDGKIPTRPAKEVLKEIRERRKNGL